MQDWGTLYNIIVIFVSNPQYLSIILQITAVHCIQIPVSKRNCHSSLPVFCQLKGHIQQLIIHTMQELLKINV